VRALEQHRFNRTAAGSSLAIAAPDALPNGTSGVNVADHVGERGDTSF
jgi:hypothetical protein